MSGILARIGAYFLAPPDDTAPPAPGRSPRSFAPPAPPAPDPAGSQTIAPAPPDAPAPAPVGSRTIGAAPPRATSTLRFSPPASPGPSTPSGCAASRPAARLRAAASPPVAPLGHPVSPTATSDRATPPAFAAVLGAAAAAIPVAAACAGELRARERAPAATLCVWRDAPHREIEFEHSPAGATTRAARRLAERLAAHGLAATACGRLAWVALGHDPAEAAAQARRCTAISGSPVVLAVAGPRPAALEPLIAESHVAIAVLPAEADEALRDVALTTLAAPEALALPPLPPGPPRWAAMAGLARLRSLREAGR